MDAEDFIDTGDFLFPLFKSTDDDLSETGEDETGEGEVVTEEFTVAEETFAGDSCLTSEASDPDFRPERAFEDLVGCSLDF